MLIGFIKPDGICEPFAEALKHPEVYGLPHGILDSLARHSRKERTGDVSVTELIDPVQVTILKRRYDYYEAPEKLITALWGKVLHRIAQEAAGENELPEQKLLIKLDGILIEGTPDTYVSLTKTLVDYKSTNVFKLKYESVPQAEWIWQLNLYRLMIQTSLNKPVEKLQALVFFRDYRPGEVKRYDWYPQASMLTYEVPVYSDTKVMDFLKERIRLWKESQNLSDSELLACTAEETWNGVRCAKYCGVARFCHQINPTKRDVANATSR